MENVGSNIHTWLDLAKAGAIFGLILMWAIFLYRQTGKYLDDVEADKEIDWERYLFPISLRLGISACVIVGLFFAFGPGRSVQDLSTEKTERMFREMPNEKPIKEIMQDASDKRPAQLKAQDRGFAEEKAEADAYIKQLQRKEK